MRLAFAAAFALLFAAGNSRADIKLPASGKLAGPLDDLKSLMADEITNYPFGTGAADVPTHGWIAIEFNPPVNRASRFKLTWRAVGDLPFFAFASGHFLTVFGETNFNSAVQLSQGDLDLVTGEIRNFELHAVFENILIQKAARYNRLPLNSKGDAFSALFVDYPPTEYPFPIPYSQRPTRVYQEVKFVLDTSEQIKGFEFRGQSFIPITLFPKLGLMPPYAFARQGLTIIPGVDGCLPGTVPENQCLSESRVPDGVFSVDNAFLGPSLHLVTGELREVPRQRVPPPALPAAGLSGAAAASDPAGRVYLFGGFDGARTLTRTALLDPATNQWTTLPDAPRASFQACAATVAGRIYVIGGRESADGAPVSTVSAFDIAGRTWAGAPPLPVPLAQAACAAVDGRVYVFGGFTAAGADSGSPVSAQAFTFDGSAWRALNPMPSPAAGAAYAVVRNEIYVINGTPDGKAVSNSVQIYSPSAAAWRTGAASTRGVYGASAVFAEGRLLVAGGRVEVDGAIDTGPVWYQNQTMQMLVGDKWFTALNPPLALSESASALAGDTWYLLGGDPSAPARSGAPASAVMAFHPAAGWLASNTTPLFTAATVRNAASLGVGPAELAPGALASILGHSLAASSLTAPPARLAAGLFTTDLPETLGGIRISIGGLPAGIVSVSPDRVDFQVPFAVASGPAVPLEFSRAGVTLPAVRVPVAEAAPGVFTYDYGETRALDSLAEAAAIANNASGRLNYPSQPAARGEAITLVCTGLGQVEPALEPFQRAGRDRISSPVRLPDVLIDGKTAAVESARLIPGEAGLYELRVRIPLDARTGVRVPVELRSGQILSNRTVIVIE